MTRSLQLLVLVALLPRCPAPPDAKTRLAGTSCIRSLTAPWPWQYFGRCRGYFCWAVTEPPPLPPTRPLPRPAAPFLRESPLRRELRGNARAHRYSVAVTPRSGQPGPEMTCFSPWGNWIADAVVRITALCLCGNTAERGKMVQHLL